MLISLEILCRSRAHCETCRDQDAGRAWRRQLAEVYETPLGDDFDCPHGLPWGYRGETALPVAAEQWPAWANLVAARATPSDIGVGSTIERELGRVGVAFKAVLATLGVPCGCADRRDEWDALYPYALTPASGPTP